MQSVLKNKKVVEISQQLCLRSIFALQIPSFIDKVLWEMKSTFFKKITLRYIYVLLIMPQLILLYLSGVPKTSIKRIVYVCKWVSVSTFTEYIFRKTNFIIFKNGWNLFCSVLIYFKMFVLSYLFTFKKWKTILISFFLTICFVVRFKPPFYHYLFRIWSFEWRSK